MIPRNNSITSQIGQLLEDYAGVMGLLPGAPDLFPAELFDSFSAQYCGMKVTSIQGVTRGQYEDFAT